jgi:hypothetical protein
MHHVAVGYGYLLTNGHENSIQQDIKPTRPTFPVPGGPYNRTPDLFGNLEEKRCLYIRGNCITAKQKKDKLAVPNLQHQLLCLNYNNQIVFASIGCNTLVLHSEMNHVKFT